MIVFFTDLTVKCSKKEMLRLRSASRKVVNLRVFDPSSRASSKNLFFLKFMIVHFSRLNHHPERQRRISSLISSWTTIFLTY
jgi:hypothetical protein